MSIYQDLWTQIKGKIDNTATVTNFFKQIIYSDQDIQISAFPALLIDFGDPAVSEENFALPKRKLGKIRVQFKMKIKNSNMTTLLTQSFQAVEILLNALDTDYYYGGKLLQISEVGTANFSKIANEVRDIILQATFTTQPFTFGNR